MPRFSIVMPAYNEENFIGSALDSLSRQTFTDYEIIVVNNASTDSTAKIAKSFGAVVVEESERGVCRARHTGTLAAKGEIVISTDADNQFSEQWLERLDIKFRSEPDLVGVGGSCIYVDGPWWTGIYSKTLFRGVDLVYRLTGKTLYASGANIAFRKKYWQGYPEFLTQGGDELYLLKQLRGQGRVAFVYDNPVYTSARRQNKGLAYNLFVTLLYYYFLEYTLSKIFKKSVIGSAPHFSGPKRGKEAIAAIIASASSVRARIIDAAQHSLKGRSHKAELKNQSKSDKEPQKAAKQERG